MVTWALVPVRGAKLLPVTVTRPPMEVDAGVKLVMTGGGGAVTVKPVGDVSV
jgi:hypothetical protein